MKPSMREMEACEGEDPSESIFKGLITGYGGYFGDEGCTDTCEEVIGDFDPE
jgi:hypothetical protein